MKNIFSDLITYQKNGGVLLPHEKKIDDSRLFDNDWCPKYIWELIIRRFNAGNLPEDEKIVITMAGYIYGKKYGRSFYKDEFAIGLDSTFGKRAIRHINSKLQFDSTLELINNKSFQNGIGVIFDRKHEFADDLLSTVLNGNRGIIFPSVYEKYLLEYWSNVEQSWYYFHNGKCSHHALLVRMQQWNENSKCYELAIIIKSTDYPCVPKPPSKSTITRRRNQLIKLLRHIRPNLSEEEIMKQVEKSLHNHYGQNLK